MTAHGGAAGSIPAVRLDGMGDMLLAGPAIRALAAAGWRVTARAGHACGAVPDVAVPDVAVPDVAVSDGDVVGNSAASGGPQADLTQPPS